MYLPPSYKLLAPRGGTRGLPVPNPVCVYLITVFPYVGWLCRYFLCRLSTVSKPKSQLFDFAAVRNPASWQAREQAKGQ